MLTVPITKNPITRRSAISLGASAFLAASTLDLKKYAHGDICPPPGTPSWNYLGQKSFLLPYRTGYSSAFGASWGVHEAPKSTRTWKMTADFHQKASNAVNYINNIAFTYATKTISWIGSAGAGGCDNLQHHGNARAFDLTRIQFSNGSAVDTVGSWAVADVGNNRAYAALIASFRRFLGPGSVLSAPIVGGHDNHVHLDSTWPWTPLSTASNADRVILRRINRVFGGSTLAVGTGDWTPADKAATQYTLYNRFRFPLCYDIHGNAWHTWGFLDAVAKHGFGNRAAGYWPPPAC